MTRYNPNTAQKPLSEVVAERRGFYEARMAKAFEAVYSSGNFQYIERFEGIVLGISQRTSQGSLEGIVIKPLEQPQAQAQQAEPTSPAEGKIDFTEYKKSRQSGMTHRQIADKYPNTGKYQLAAYASNLARWKKVQDAADPRPTITYELFVTARNAGVANKQIMQQYKREYPMQINIFSMKYSRAKKASQTSAVQNPAAQTQ